MPMMMLSFLFSTLEKKNKCDDFHDYEILHLNNVLHIGTTATKKNSTQEELNKWKKKRTSRKKKKSPEHVLLM